ncbi:fasciclin domain-containing protein, partial [Klebsiella pneumoniae]|uniref:fasciclin domain-containing protein n=1 Tax=Klebsiella pneumoniae TaxID=573 RepID=UPI003854744B
VPTLLKPENKGTLTTVLTYHVVAGKLDAAALRHQVMAGHGKATLKTVQGETLTVTAQGRKLVLTDAKGGSSTITIPDVRQSNGVIHVVDT